MITKIINGIYNGIKVLVNITLIMQGSKIGVLFCDSLIKSDLSHIFELCGFKSNIKSSDFNLFIITQLYFQRYNRSIFKKKASKYQKQAITMKLIKHKILILTFSGSKARITAINDNSHPLTINEF